MPQNTCYYSKSKEWGRSGQRLDHSKTEIQQNKHQLCSSLSRVKGLDVCAPCSFATYNLCLRVSSTPRPSHILTGSLPVCGSPPQMSHNSGIFNIWSLHCKPGFIFTASHNSLSQLPTLSAFRQKPVRSSCLKPRRKNQWPSLLNPWFL